jgi:glycosyltransferase involved in cell wall biosynthesis
MTRPLRVLHVVAGISDRYGGVTATVLALCRAQNRRGVEAEIAATDADGQGKRLSLNTIADTLVPLHMFRCDFSERWKFSRGLWSWLVAHAGRFNLVHIHGLWNFATTAAFTAARRHRVPALVAPHGMLSDYTWTRSPFVKNIYWRLIERYNLAGASGLHLMSHGESNELSHLRLGLPTYCIPIGLDAEAWEIPPRREYLRSLCGVQVTARPVLLFLSRLHPKKGILDLLLPAFRRLVPDALLVIAGGQDSHAPEHADAVRREVARLGLAPHVCLLGPVKPQNRWAVLDGADIFVLPSHQENFGLVVTEAMARGLPIVVSETTDSCEHVIAAGAGHVVPLNVDALVRALAELLGNTAGRVAAGERGQRYTREHLSWDRIIPLIKGMYHQCLASRQI